MKHGTNSGYVYHGCRCDPCRGAHREYDIRRKYDVAALHGRVIIPRPALRGRIARLSPVCAPRGSTDWRCACGVPVVNPWEHECAKP